MAVRTGPPVPFPCSETNELGENSSVPICTKFISTTNSNPTITAAFCQTTIYIRVERMVYLLDRPVFESGRNFCAAQRGKKGGKARMAALTSEERTELARKAVQTRWVKAKKKNKRQAPRRMIYGALGAAIAGYLFGELTLPHFLTVFVSRLNHPLGAPESALESVQSSPSTPVCH
jgi:hypothetical protein